MLLALAVLLLLFWAGGFLAFHVVTGFIHVLLLLALISFVLHFFTGWGRRGPVV